MAEDKSYWLVKTEPETFSWDDMVAEKRTVWDGVRNYQARNNLREMQEGDLVFVYHSGKKREVVGLAEVVKVAYPDPTTDDERWVAVDLVAGEKLENPVSLAEIKANPDLAELPLIKNSRLSVSPVTPEAFQIIFDLSQANKPTQ